MTPSLENSLLLLETLGERYCRSFLLPGLLGAAGKSRPSSMSSYWRWDKGFSKDPGLRNSLFALSPVNQSIIVRPPLHGYNLPCRVWWRILRVMSEIPV